MSFWWLLLKGSGGFWVTSPPLRVRLHICVCDGLDGFFRQQGWITKNGCGCAQLAKGTQHHGSEHWKGAVTIEPLQCGLTQLCPTCSGHHRIEWLKERLDDDAKNPELPVLKSAVLHILIELLLHVVEALPPDGHPCRRQLFLTWVNWGVELLYLLS